MIQLAIVAVGLGALLTTSSLAFNIVKISGAAYLVWLGVQKWRAVPQEIDADSAQLKPNALFIEGLLVNLTNPKAIVFIAALTPQFIDPSRPQWPQFLIIGLTMCGVDTVVMSCYALLATRLRHWLHDARSLKAQNRFFGGVFVGAGVLLASSSR
jgi:homoserine/homoserine lactone efflux protein